MRNDNSEMYREIIKILTACGGLRFGELNMKLGNAIEEKYEVKRLRNLLSRKVQKGELQRSKEGIYSIAQRGEDNMEREETVYLGFVGDMLEVCRKKRKEFMNPFARFKDNRELLAAKEAYDVNEEIIALLERRQNNKAKDTTRKDGKEKAI